MKPEWRRFAPIGLYLAIVAAIVSAALFIIMRDWNLYLQISLALIVLGLGLFALLDPQRVQRAFSGRQAKYGSNALVLSLAFAGILVLINVLISNNTQRWDLTEDKTFTLAPETLDILKNLSEPVEAKAFFTGSLNNESAQNLLEQYEYNSDGNFTFVFIDPDSNPVAAEEAKITKNGTIVLTMGENQEQVTVASEQELTAALVRLKNPEKKIVYFLTGHGEYSPEDTGEQSYSLVKRTLEGRNYVVKMLNLLTTNEIPEDAEAIVIAGAREALSQSEMDLLSAYLDSGGGLISLMEPVILTNLGETPDPLEIYFKENWGIGFRNDVIVDPASFQGIYTPFAAQYGNHPITEKIQRTTSQFHSVRSIEADLQESGASLVELVLTSGTSWAETDVATLEEKAPEFDENTDIQGPISIAVTGEKFEIDAKIVVFGDADFATDVLFYAYANSDLFVNSVDWVAGKEDSFSLTPKNNIQRIVVPPEKIYMNLIFFGVVIVMPAIAVIGGFLVWSQKRRRG